MIDIGADLQRAFDEGYEKGKADRPQGEWLEKGIYDNNDGEREMVEQWQAAKCSICERWFTTPYLYYFDEHNYCPHCGAKMKG